MLCGYRALLVRVAAAANAVVDVRGVRNDYLKFDSLSEITAVIDSELAWMFFFVFTRER